MYRLEIVTLIFFSTLSTTAETKKLAFEYFGRIYRHEQNYMGWSFMYNSGRHSVNVCGLL